MRAAGAEGCFPRGAGFAWRAALVHPDPGFLASVPGGAPCCPDCSPSESGRKKKSKRRFGDTPEVPRKGRGAGASLDPGLGVSELGPELGSRGLH